MERRWPSLFLPLAFTLALAACFGGSHDGEPTDVPQDGGSPSVDPMDSSTVDPNDLPPDFTYAPEGDPEPPTVDEALAEATVLETATLVATGAEDTLTLVDGFEMIVPAGALAAGDTVQVDKVEFTDSPPGVADAVYVFTASAQPASAVTITFPIPGDLTDLANHDVYVAWHHERDTAVTLDGTVDEVAGTIEVQTTTFSTGVVTNEGVIPDPPPEPNHVIQMPYFNQGASGNCWSVAGSMLLTAYANPQPDALEDAKLTRTWHLNEFFHVNAEHGFDFYPFLYGPKMRNLMLAKVPDAELERHVWFLLTSETKLKNYLIGNVLNDEPTMVYVKNPEAHMLLLVGYQKEGTLERFIIHDPATNAYTSMLWHELRNRFSVGGFDQAGTLSLGKPVPALGTRATILIPFAATRSQGVDFIGLKKDGKFDLASISVFSWYAEALMSFGVVNVATKAPQAIKPTDRAFMTVALASSIHPDAEGGAENERYKVGFEVFDPTFGMTFSSPKRDVSLVGGELEELKFIDDPKGMPVSTFATTSGVHKINFYIEDASGRRHDEAEISIDVTDPCGDGLCDAEAGEDETSCPKDCKEEECGDGICTTGEVCLLDCHCGNGQCESFDPADPVFETMESCPEDCHCGNGICEPDKGEEATFCSIDCHCGDGACDMGLFGSSIPEDATNCPADCANCTADLCGPNTSLCCNGQCCGEFAFGCDANGCVGG